MNHVILIGRLTRDPELRYTASGIAVVNFRIAVDRRFKDKATGEKPTDFFDVSAWRQTAEFVANYITKGRLVAVAGTVQNRKYTDKAGQERQVTEIIADEVQPLDKPKDPSAAGSAPPPPVGTDVAPDFDDTDPFANA